VFTRIGASDRLIENKSTFYIEMEETKSILDSASAKSLVIIDELGRGTSTFDGMSIAEATFKHLCEKIKCMGLFATHYNILVEDFLFDSKVSVYHMSYIVNEGTKDIRFMYKLKQGKCDESFAVNVARMVNINCYKSFSYDTHL
jgi:DNA mismatch repair protein MSH6